MPGLREEQYVNVWQAICATKAPGQAGKTLCAADGVACLAIMIMLKLTGHMCVTLLRHVGSLHLWPRCRPAAKAY